MERLGSIVKNGKCGGGERGDRNPEGDEKRRTWRRERKKSPALHGFPTALPASLPLSLHPFLPPSLPQGLPPSSPSPSTFPILDDRAKRLKIGTVSSLGPPPLDPAERHKVIQVLSSLPPSLPPPLPHYLSPFLRPSLPSSLPPYLSASWSHFRTAETWSRSCY